MHSYETTCGAIQRLVVLVKLYVLYNDWWLLHKGRDLCPTLESSLLTKSYTSNEKEAQEEDVVWNKKFEVES